MYYSNCQLLSKSFSMATIKSHRNVLENAQLENAQNRKYGTFYYIADKSNSQNYSVLIHWALLSNNTVDSFNSSKSCMITQTGVV